MEKPIIINNWQRGIQSAYTGFADMRNLDFTTKPGILMLNPKTVKQSGTSITGLPYWTVINGGDKYHLDNDGEVYKNFSKITRVGSVAGSGNGLAYWKDFLFYLSNTSGWSYGNHAGTITWYNSGVTAFITMDSATKHPTCSSVDDKLYIGCGRYVASLAEVDGEDFNPATSSTFTYTQRALDLPEGYSIKSIFDLGNRLMIAANNSATNNSVLFPWDRESSSFDKPISFGKQDIHACISKNNLAHIIAGREPHIFVTDGVTLQDAISLPNTFTGLDKAEKIQIYSDAIEYFNNKVYFAISQVGASNVPAGVYSFDGKAIVLEHVVSTGNYVGTNDISIPTIKAINDTQLSIGWEDFVDGTAGIDYTSSGNLYTGYTGYFATQLYRVGEYNRPRTFKNIGIYLGTPMDSNAGIKCYYRIDINTAWSSSNLFATFDTGGKMEFFQEFAKSAKTIQFKFEMTTGASTSTSPEMLEIRIH